MKCINNLVSAADLANEENKSTFYTDTELTKEKMSSSEVEVAILRGELEIIQRALKVQTRRCRQLVTEYTKRLQLKEQHYQAEKRLRDDQLAQVLRALLIFEARLKQEQKLIASKLQEKDAIIKKQQLEMQKITSNRYCKKCNQCFNINLNLESMDSSSEYVVTDYHDYQSSTLESLDSSSETYASISEKDFDPKKLLYSNPSISSEDNIKIDSQRTRHLFTKNKNKDSLGRRGKKFIHRKSVGNYFETINRQSDEHSPSSNEENTSNDYENLDSLPSENFQSNVESEQTENEEQGYISDSINTTVIVNKRLNNNQEGFVSPSKSNSSSDTLEDTDEKIGTKISDVIPVFEGDGEVNDNWYASASDQEDDDNRNIYRNNPVLECMNQILMQNLKDTIHSPPKSPNVEKRCSGNKRVKFSDEEEKHHDLVQSEHLEGNYYETPTQKPPNYYETPQSIYSNDYEQILSQCSETFNQECSDVDKDKARLEDNSSHYYIDMDTSSEKAEKEAHIVRKSKILRIPPALPPKPANLLSKYKVQNITQEISNENLIEKSFDSEPDYCSISEINLPTTDANDLSKRELEEVSPITPNRERLPKKLSAPPENVTVAKIENDSPKNLLQYKPVLVEEPVPNMVMKKSVEKVKSQVAKQTPIKSDSPKKSLSPEIPKLPQVTEIIIPDENEAISEEYINHDNYVKNNTQILKQQPDRTRPIQMGCSVSSLIASFNNKQILSEIKHSPRDKKEHKRQFASFENLNELESNNLEESESKRNSFDTFDLSQNFEEFNLDECDIEDYSQFTDVDQTLLTSSKKENSIKEPNKSFNLNCGSSTRVEVVRATNNFSVPQQRANSLYQMKKKIEMEKNRVFINNQLKNETIPTNYKEPTYEHFLECTGLSSKSILTPSRLLSNHKNMLKPKDVKLRSKIKSNNVYEKDENNSVRYWSEPYL